jgi:hypothetical protein
MVWNCELGPTQCYSPDPLKLIAPGARSDRALVVTVPPPSGQSYQTVPCHLLLPASTRSPCSTTSTCASPVSLIHCKPSSRSKCCFLLFHSTWASARSSACCSYRPRVAMLRAPLLLRLERMGVATELCEPQANTEPSWLPRQLAPSAIFPDPRVPHRRLKVLATTDTTASTKTSTRPLPTPCRFHVGQAEHWRRWLLRWDVVTTFASAPHRASLSPRNAPRPHQHHQRPPANLPHWRAPSAKVHRHG